MAGNSLESLLAWMKDDSRMLEWDLIVALDGRNINRDFQQDYITRLSQGNDLGDINLSIDIPDTNVTQYLSGVKLAAPALSFDKASLQSTKTALSLPVVGGTLMMVETVEGQKKIIRLSGLDPLDGTQLRLDMPPGADSRSVQLDLANSEDVLLTLFHTPAQQREAGKLFLEWFKALNYDKRVYTLATFPDEGNPLMLSHSIDVRTQKRDAQTLALAPDAIDEDGAVLLFTSMAEGRKGHFPGDNAGFRYLIPDADGQKTWSGTALFSRALIHRAAFGYAVSQSFDSVMFDRVTDDAGTLKKMVARIGDLQVPAGSYQNLDYQFESDAFNIPSTGGALPLTVEFDEDQAIQHWQSTFPLSFRYRPISGANWESQRATFNIRLEHAFRFSADESSVLGMEGELFVPYANTQEVSHVSGLPGTITPDLLQQINDFVAQTVKRAILERFSNTLTATSSDAFLSQFDIVGKSILQPTDAALPYDLAMFGQVHGQGSSFSIIQPQSLVAAGKTLQLSTEPPRTGLKWTVGNLSESGSNPGSINEQGLYQAPPRHSIQGTFNRVLIIASDPATGERSVTLITVQSNPITVNPQIQTCFHGERVELSAGGIGTNTLSWSVKNPVPGESGTLVVSDQPEGDHAYIAGPQVEKKTWVLDEIEVRDSQTEETGSAWVLVMQNEPGATIKPVDNPSQPEGQIQLQAFVNGEPITGEWSLPLGGPGSIDSSGLYLDDPLAKDRFVLITVLVDGGGFGYFEGHLILPRPLTDFPTVLKALAE
jgi:hypothetical protein